MDLGPFFDNSSDYLAVSTSGSAHWTVVNPALAARLGWSPEDAVARKAMNADDPSALLCADGTRLHVEWKIVPAEGVDYWIGREVSTDAVREVHHRIKNHMQLLISLLNLQSSESSDKTVLNSLAVARTRVQAIARLYEPLYASADFQWIEFGAYLRHLAAEQMDSGAFIETSDVVLDIDEALPLGLIAADTLHNRLRSVELAYVAANRIEFRATASARLELPSAEVVGLLAQQLGADLLVSEQRLSVTFTISKI